jgi:Zn finger protein HypA/HybF involved in hydrogenase expression
MTEEKEFKFSCNRCKYYTNYNSLFSKHKKTKKHIKNYELELEIQKIDEKKMKFQCEYCNYYTNNRIGFYQHKRTKKHKKNVEENQISYKCEKCDYGTNNQSSFIKHHNDKHISSEDLKQTYNNITNNINTNCNNTTNNNIFNIHIHNDKKSYQLMLNNMSNDSFLSLLGGVNEKEEFYKNKLWDETEIRNKFIKNIMTKTIENKKENKSINDIKVTDANLKNNKIQIKEQEEKYKKCDSNYFLGNILQNNLALTKSEHMNRIKENREDYINYLLMMNSFTETIDFKKGYEYNFNDIINRIIDNTEKSIDYVRLSDNINKHELEEQIENYNYVLKCFKEMKRKLNFLTD